jgi:lipopolysaccharide transport system permease protein
MSVTLDHPAQSLVGSHLDLTADSTRLARNRLAVHDVADGLRLWRLAVTLGWLDIKLRYRGSMLGPFWLTLSTGVMVGALGLVYGTLFSMNLREFLPFLSVSLVMWNAIGQLIGDACNAFTQAEGTIRSVRMPFFLQAIRVVVRNVLVLAHNVVVFVVVFAIYGLLPGTEALMALPGLLLWLADAFACCLLLGTLCSRFRDIPPIVGSIVQIAFYITPVVWKPEQLGARGWWLPLNPFDGLLDVVRGPLLSQPPSWLVWGSALGFSILLWAAAWLVFARVRARLAFWV